MRSLIIDDEPDSHLVLTDQLRRQHPNIKVVDNGYNVAEGKSLITTHRPDLVFLDIDMPDGTGFDLLQQLPERDFHLIFVTAFNQYAQTAIRMGALDYLLKPVDPLELKVAINRAQAQQLARIQLEQLQIMQDTLQQLTARQLPARMSIATAEGVLYFPAEQVIRLEAMQNFTEFKIQDDERRLIASHHLKKYETDLKPYPSFQRIHKSHLINVLQVTRFIRGEKAYVEMSDGSIVPVSRKYRPVLEQRLQELLG
mgnify:FL=1